MLVIFSLKIILWAILLQSFLINYPLKRDIQIFQFGSRNKNEITLSKFILSYLYLICYLIFPPIFPLQFFLFLPFEGSMNFWDVVAAPGISDDDSDNDSYLCWWWITIKIFFNFVLIWTKTLDADSLLRKVDSLAL